MARYVVTSPVVIPDTDYLHKGRVHKKGEVVELSAAEVTSIGAGNLRAVTTTTMHDQLGESAGCSNGD